jgi:hypothetical protein
VTPSVKKLSIDLPRLSIAREVNQEAEDWRVSPTREPGTPLIEKLNVTTQNLYTAGSFSTNETELPHVMHNLSYRECNVSNMHRNNTIHSSLELLDSDQR